MTRTGRLTCTAVASTLRIMQIAQFLAPLATAVAWLGAGLLVYAGAIKFPVPDGAMAALHSLKLPSGRGAARILGLGEIVVGMVIVLVGGVVGAALSTLTYAVLAGIAARQRAEQIDCGCFGVRLYPVSRLHVMLNLVIAAGSALGLAAPLHTLTMVGQDAGFLAQFSALVVIGTGVWILTFMTERAGMRQAASL